MEFILPIARHTAAVCWKQCARKYFVMYLNLLLRIVEEFISRWTRILYFDNYKTAPYSLAKHYFHHYCMVRLTSLSSVSITKSSSFSLFIKSEWHFCWLILGMDINVLYRNSNWDRIGVTECVLVLIGIYIWDLKLVEHTHLIYNEK